MPSAALPPRTPVPAGSTAVFDRLAGIVKQILDVPVALVSLVEQDGRLEPGTAGSALAGTPRTALPYSLCDHVVATSQPVVVADIGDIGNLANMADIAGDPVLRHSLDVTEAGVGAYAGIPLTEFDGTVVGCLCAIDVAAREWTPSEIGLLTDIAAACSAELHLRSAAALTERSRQLSEALLVLSETLSGTTTLVDVAEVLDSLARDHLGASFGGINLFDETRTHLTYVDRTSLPASFEPNYARFPLTAATPSSTVVQTGLPLYFPDVETFVAAYPVSGGRITAGGTRAGAYHPLELGGETLGVLALLWDEPRVFESDDRAVLAALGRYTAQAVQRAVLLADRHEVAETLQSAMLPVLPALPWVELAGRYLPARAHDAVGGDWYDAFELAAGELALSVGDVEGHDTVAAAVMGQVRSTVRALAVTVPGGPDRVLGAVDDVFAALPPARYATCVLATITSADTGGTLRWTSAAHTSPVLLVPGSEPQLLRSRPQLPVGLQLRQPRLAHTRTLPPGATVLLYTDGLVERRGRDFEETTADLLRAADRHRALPLADMVDAILADLVTGLGADSHDDDVVLFGVRLAT